MLLDKPLVSLQLWWN